MDLHKQLEERLARFKHTESCLIFPSGYVANLAALTAIVEEGDVLLNDEVNHASIVDGCRSSRGTLRFYKHNNLENLEKKLAQYGTRKPKLIITDGVFSMDGDVAPVDKILTLAKRYNAMLMVDDAHSTGVVGQTGRGSAEHCGVLGKVDITTVTLSKALGAIGGAICGSRNLIKKIFNLSRPFIFTSALPPSVCASVMAAIDVIESEPELVRNVQKNRDILCSGLRAMGYRVPPTESAVIPVIIGNEVKTYQLATRLDELNVFVNAVSRPAVPREYSRLRISVMATHTEEHLKEALAAFRRAGEELGLKTRRSIRPNGSTLFSINHGGRGRPFVFRSWFTCLPERARPSIETVRAFFNLSLGIWNISDVAIAVGPPDWSLFLDRLSYVWATLMVPSFVFLSSEFANRPVRSRWVKRMIGWPGIFILGSAFTPWLIEGVKRPPTLSRCRVRFMWSSPYICFGGSGSVPSKFSWVIGRRRAEERINFGMSF